MALPDASLVSMPSVAFRPDAKVLAIGSEWDGSIALWPMQRGAESYRVPVSGTAAGLAFSTDELLLVLTEDGNLYSFDVLDGNKVRLRESLQIGPDQGSPTCSLDGRFLAVTDRSRPSP